jgi:hypothetical protein
MKDVTPRWRTAQVLWEVNYLQTLSLSAAMYLLRYNETMIKYAKNTCDPYWNKDKAAFYEQ